MYHNLAQIISGLEDIINDYNAIHQQDEFYYRFDINVEKISDKEFAEYILNGVQSQNISKGNSNVSHEDSFKQLFRYMLKSITDLQDKVIKNNYIEMSEQTYMQNKLKQTFLSYAYYDMGLSMALFYYFWERKGFLYVDWMMEGVNKHGSTIKEKLETALYNSDQFLFLRTINSELRARGNNNIRQRCAWEIGDFYTKHKNEKYYTSFYDREEPSNVLLDTFRPMQEVILGEMH